MSPVVGLTPANSSLPAAAMTAVIHRRANPAPYGWQVLTVRNGDNLSDLAITYRTTVGVLLARNRFHDDGSFLAVGRQLWVPRTTRAPRRAVPARNATYVVRPGDTLGDIAARYKVRLSTLLSLNRISPTAYIQPGQRIRVPARAVRARTKARAHAAVTTTIVTVRSGDTLGGIALRQHVSLASLIKANRLSLRSILQIGQRLRVVTPARRNPYSSNTFAGRTYSDKIVNAAAANRRYLARHQAPSRIQTRAIIVSTARRHGLDPRLVLAVSWQESGWNQRLVSVANAIGAMQIIPSTRTLPVADSTSSTHTTMSPLA